MSISQEYSTRRINASIEYSTGNMKDIKPIAIVENNKQISDYSKGDLFIYNGLSSEKELARKFINNNINIKSFFIN